MTKQKVTIIDELVTKLAFKTDTEALDRAKKKIEDIARRIQAMTRGVDFVVPHDGSVQRGRIEREG